MRNAQENGREPDVSCKAFLMCQRSWCSRSLNKQYIMIISIERKCSSCTSVTVARVALKARSVPSNCSEGRATLAQFWGVAIQDTVSADPTAVPAVVRAEASCVRPVAQHIRDHELSIVARSHPISASHPAPRASTQRDHSPPRIKAHSAQWRRHPSKARRPRTDSAIDRGAGADRRAGAQAR